MDTYCAYTHIHIYVFVCNCICIIFGGNFVILKHMVSFVPRGTSSVGEAVWPHFLLFLERLSLCFHIGQRLAWYLPCLQFILNNSTWEV